ncbi:zinc-dependent alcohol dehydrogenase family protein [Rhodovulum sp. MB263]|uniref:zinc-dependent alcohol dehydrogenase family protein n=1 Tax=Rhodovulum sp. (strain MB263) TaxID=308754 RepID=UPI0009B7DE08|nr:zinc-dependent alcohol dehydrogenase family protein [Rhodovulum sp. MB263]ARC89733.1 alcohol dehydrogenase [Rhodovulum sp. MB263]
MQVSSLVCHAFGPPRDALSLETRPLGPRPEPMLRVAMLRAPVNPSDLVPVTGAYAHRIVLPFIAGYEGVGRVLEAPPGHAGLIGRRVLPLRGPGTWQTVLDCDPALAIPVPEDIGDDLAARAYINPLAARGMLSRWPVAGRRVLLSGAGSHCADLLGQWALGQGAAVVTGVHRSPSRAARLRTLGIDPVPAAEEAQVLDHARRADIVFDALGGLLASRILDVLPEGAHFVGYGLLTGRPVRPASPPRARFERFHLRDCLASMSAADWRAAFEGLWPGLATADLPGIRPFALTDWRQALDAAGRPGAEKPMLCFGAPGV